MDHSQKSHKSDDQLRKGRIFRITDETYKILCQADKKDLNATKGLENLASMFVALSGPVDYEKLDLERALKKAKELKNFMPNKN